VDAAGPYGQTLVEKVKKGKRREVCSLTLRSSALPTIEHTTGDRKAYDQTQAMSTRVSRGGPSQPYDFIGFSLLRGGFCSGYLRSRANSMIDRIHDCVRAHHL
jgi:hypothetical protein